VKDNQILNFVTFDQLEGRTNGPNSSFKWDGQGWIGTDLNKLWIKSEGMVTNGISSDGDHEILYDRPMPHMRYFDWQAGARLDLDSGPTRAWAALGVQGLAPYFFNFAPTLYVRDGGRVAGRIQGSYDFYLSQRLILQPQVEMNFYSQADPARGIGSGFSASTAACESDISFRASSLPTSGTHTPAYSARLLHSVISRGKQQAHFGLCLAFGCGTDASLKNSGRCMGGE
jgi:copper resistance protein B